jgi:hypothetical protein
MVFRSHDVERYLDYRVIEYKQRVIIKFLTSESVDTQEIHTRLRAQFSEQAYALRTIQF